MAKKTYTTTRAVKHDGKHYDEGQPIDLEDSDAEPLLARGAIVAKLPAKAKAEKDA